MPMCSSRRTRDRRLLAQGFLAAVLATSAGCSFQQEASLSSNAPEGQIEGILKVTRENDTTAIPQLVALLDSGDPLIRLLAIRALERFTGQTMGYRHEAEPFERNLAIERWVAAVEAGRFAQATSTATSDPAQGQGS